MFPKGILERQNKILEIIVSSYVNTASPVGSRMVSKMVGLSSATIRNIMSDLEELGYIMHPHTSAGRMPTDKGYRWYVESLTMATEINRRQAQRIDEEYKLRKKNIEDIVRKTAQVLSSITRQTGMVLFPMPKKTAFKHIDLISTGKNKILVVLVTSAGMVENFIIDTERDFREDLDKIANLLNGGSYGISLEEIKERLIRQVKRQRDSSYFVLREASDIVELLLNSVYGDELYLEGTSCLLSQPEFEDAKAVRPILEFFEHKRMLLDLMEEDLNEEGLRIYIGKENKCHHMQNCSIVTTGYKIKDGLIGRLGIIGPTRMEYDYMIPVVNYVSQAVSRMLGELVE